MEFEKDDKEILKIAPMRRVMRFIEPFEILERVEDWAYHLALPPKL